jgi:hypothetical protein
MGIARGPNLIKDNLVFGYDTGYGIADNNTSTRFYPGEPATNEFYNSGAAGNILDHSSGYGGYGTVQTGALDAFGTTNCNVYRNTGKIRLGPTGGQDIGTLTNGSTYTWSIYLKHVSGQTESTSMEFDIVDRADSRSYSGTLGSNMTYEWKRFSVTALHNNSSNYHFLDLGTYQGTNVFDWCMPQIDVGSHATPHTKTSRANTASLIDLKRTTNIDVANVSFDSTGQPSFDETDDHITGTLPLSGLGQPHTVEMVFSCNVNQGSIGSRKDPFSIGNSSSHQYSALDVNTGNMNWYFYGKDTTFTNSPLMVADQFYHIVLSYAGGYSNNTNKKVWINGIQQTLSAGVNETPLLPNNPNFSVGRDRGRNTAYWPGEIPVWKVYQRAFTEDEAKQNFNAYKNRFNI